ncbi:MAG TPA: hypothetical protein VHO72_09420 [Bacteroidales bacterium]|nr:hypothetical protein [Bacteroidales bacterium]
MYKFSKLSIVLSLIIFISCKKDGNNIDISLIKDYYFIYNGEYEFENGHMINNDTVIFSFEKGDSIRAIRHYYKETASGENIYLKSDTAYRNYYIKSNRIKFDIIIYDYYKLVVINNSLWDGEWEITSINEDFLKFDLYTNKGLSGKLTLKCAKK